MHYDSHGHVDMAKACYDGQIIASRFYCPIMRGYPSFWCAAVAQGVSRYYTATSQNCYALQYSAAKCVLSVSRWCYQVSF
jgi:hypothetical protein